MRLLFFTDTHIRGTSPKNRKDDFTSSLEKKFNEIIKIIDEKNIDYVLHGGDLFDKPDLSVAVVSRFAKILQLIKVPIYMVSGNHDIFGHNPLTINRTVMGLLDNLNVLNIIKENEVVLLEKDGIKVQLTGQPYVYDIDNEKDKSYYKIDNIKEGVNYSIHLVHGMLLDKPFIKGIPYTLVDDIKDTKANITLSGHYHAGFSTIKIDDKYFVNPGSIVRITNSIKEIERRPKLVLIDLSDDIKLSYIYLKSAVDGNEILDRKEIERNVFRSERIYEFKQTVDAALNFDKMDINDVLIEVSNSAGVEDEVKIEALRRIAEIQMKGLKGE